ncbi:MAG: class I SAM-dependent methyltransferase [Lachnospiraceae bacterium]|nr:class I SAM-dependent methyltransferase [Lachnospiraceae bacterium]
MASYESFARVYDLFMSDTPYDEWCEYLHELLVHYGVSDGLVLELGCGTGSMTERLAQCGYDMIGVDNSVDMLEIAREKQTEGETATSTYVYSAEESACFDDTAAYSNSEKSGTVFEKVSGDTRENDSASSEILYLLQDMREFELYGTVRAVVSVCDSMNYITEEEDLLQVFHLVNNYLDPGGVFIFDMNTIFKYEEILADNVFAENREEGSFIWENWYDAGTQINEYDLTLYIRSKRSTLSAAGDEESDSVETCHADEQFEATSRGAADQFEGAAEDFYERYEEVHYQRAWSISHVCDLLEEAGLHLEAVYDAFTWDEPTQESERVYFVAREVQKPQHKIE